MGKRKDTDVIYLDFRKAFDSVPQQGFLAKLKSIEFSGNAFDEFRNSLWGRIRELLSTGCIPLGVTF